MTKMQEFGLDKFNREELCQIRDEIDLSLDEIDLESDPVRQRIEAKIRSGEIRELTVEQAIDLEERTDFSRANPEIGIPWEDVQAR